MTISKELLDELLSGVERPEDLLGDKGLIEGIARIGQIDRMLGGGGIGWKAAIWVLNRMVFRIKPAVQAFDGVGGVDDLAHRWREGQRTAQ